MKCKSILLGVLFAASSMSVVAEEAEPKLHSFGVTLGNGGAEYKGSSADGDGIAQFYAHYNFQFSEKFSFEAGLLGGADVDDWRCTELNNNGWVCRSENRPFFDIQADELSYSSIILAAKGELKISARNSLYAKLGGQFYDYEFSRNKVKLDNDSGFGLFAEAGWQMKWNSGWGINAGIQFLDMGDLDTQSFNIGVTYSF